MPTEISQPLIIPSVSGHCVLESDTKANPNSGGYNFSLYYSSGTWNNGPPHEPTYIDDGWAWGVNMAGIGVRKDPGKQYAAWHVESKFYQGPSQPSPLTEMFLHVVDINGQVRRPIAWIGRHDGSYSDIVNAASLISLQDADHNAKLTYDFRAANHCRVEDGFSFTFADNNRPVARQYNADGTSAHALPYIDDMSNTAIARPITTPVTGGNAAGPTLTTRGESSAGARIQAPDAKACSIEISCGKSSARKAATVTIDNGNNLVIGQTGSGGSLFYDFNHSVIFRSRQAGHANAAELTSRSFALGVPVKLRCYTRATLPAAATCGEGSMIYVKDAPGGAAPAVSDGSSWRPLVLGPPL